MAASLIFSDRALADLDRLRLFIAAQSPRQAQRAIARIITALDLLMMFPRAGAEIRSDIRRFVIKHGRSAYIVRYQLRGEDVIVLRIRHSKEQPAD